MDICHMVNTAFFSLKKTWKENVKGGHWTQVTSGGCPNNKDTFLNNPQVGFAIYFLNMFNVNKYM